MIKYVSFLILIASILIVSIPSPSVIQTFILIENPVKVETIWDILTTIDDYHHWNPSRSGKGRLEQGKRIEWILANGVPDDPICTRLEKWVFEWSGTLLHPSFMHGTHWFKLDIVDGGVLLEQSEKLDGVLAKIVLYERVPWSAMVRRFIEKDLENVNRSLKKYAVKLQLQHES